LLVEVEAYARHATLNQSSDLDSLIKQSATQQYPQSDFSQDVVLLVMEKLSQFDDSKSLFSTWLYRVVKNARIDAIRRIKRKQPREGEFNDKFMQPAGNGGYRGSSCKSGDGALEVKSSKRVELHRSQDHDTPRSSLADPEPASVSLSAERPALLVAELPRLDRKFIELFYKGYTLEEIAAKSFKDAKFAYNQFARIKKDLRKLSANHGWPVAIPASRKRTSVEGEIPSEPHEFATTS
jgi:RNA polymerase sigma factor (sigma-70 family)